MTKIFKATLTITCLILLMTNMVMAADLSLAWDANPDPDIAGYKVYYQADSVTQPFRGVEAIEGNSPIDAGPATSFSLTGLPDGSVYYIAVSAYNSTGEESVLSNIVASDWVPELIAPVKGALNEPTAEKFIWEDAPSDYDVTYTLYYGTGPELKVATNLAPLKWPRIKLQSPTLLFLLVLLGLFVTIGRSTKRKFATGILALSLGLALAGCGGGGSDGGGLNGAIVSVGDTTSPSTELPIEGGPTTYFVFKDKADYHEVYDLEPSTTYYWKVVAQAVSNPNKKYESQTNSFTTSAN